MPKIIHTEYALGNNWSVKAEYDARIFDTPLPIDAMLGYRTKTPQR